MSNFSVLKFRLRLENKIEIVNKLLRTTLDTLQPLPKLLVSVEYTVKTVLDKLLNLRNEDARNKFTQKTLLRNDHLAINLQIITNTNLGFNA